MSLPPCAALSLKHRDSVDWDAKPRVTQDNITVHCARNPFGSLDCVKVTGRFEGLAPETIMCVYAWSERDEGNMAAPMNAHDELRVDSKCYGPTSSPNSDLRALIDARGSKKFEEDKKQLQWKTAEELLETAPPSETEQVWHIVTRSPMMLVAPRDWAWRKEDPYHLSPSQREEWGFKGDTWVSGFLPASHIPKKSGHERAVGFRWVVTAEAYEGGTEFTIIGAFDMSGSLPAMLLNSVNARMADFAARTETQARVIHAIKGGPMTPDEYLKLPKGY